MGIARPLRLLRRRIGDRVRSFVGETPRRLKAEDVARFVESGQLVIGRRTYGLPRIVSIGIENTPVRIGAFCSIAEDVEIFLGGNHRPDWVSTFPFRAIFGISGAWQDGLPATKGAVTIGNDVWIGRGATIMSGVTIGDGSVIGARSVVSQDVRPYAIVTGNPAREVRRRFSDEHVERLLASRWWDRPDDWLVTVVDLLCSEMVEEFLAAAESRPSAPSRDETAPI
jgi:acetyltransferase-like isoleucine patch superfamily enzyme